MMTAVAVASSPTVFFHGMVEPSNPIIGHGAWAWVAINEGGQLAFGKQYMGMGDLTSSLAAYQGLIEALTWIKGRYGKTSAPILVRGSNQLVVNQATDRFACNEPKLRERLTRVQTLLPHIHVLIGWVRKEENLIASEMCADLIRQGASNG